VRRERRALLTLLFLSPVLGELVSGSSPPLEFLSPNLLGLLALYGCGALLIRDAAIRWDKGWATLLLLGCAYGVFEEGLVVKSWFDPNWVDLGEMGTYGRAGGINWVWAASLTLYHAVVSIALPIFLVGVLFPDLKRTPLLTPRATRYALFLFALTLPVYALALPYWGGPEHLVAVIAAGAFLQYARMAPRDFLAPLAVRPPERVWTFAAFGFLWMFGTFLFPSVANASGVHFAVTLGVLAFAAAAALLGLRGALHPANAERCLFAFLAGAYGFIIMFGFLYGFFNPIAGFGMVAVAPAGALWFAWVYRRNLARWRAAPAPAAGPAPPAPAA
jgi:hypothetical protein